MRNMKALFGIFILVFSLATQAEKFRDNELKFGRPQSNKDKTIHWGSNGVMRYSEANNRFEMSSDGGNNYVEIQPVGGFADSSLSNLVAPTQVNIPFLPASGSQVDIGSPTAIWGDVHSGYGGNTGFKIVDDVDNEIGLSIQKTTARYGQERTFTGNGFGIIGEKSANGEFLILKTADNPTTQTAGIILQTGDASDAGDSGDIWFVTGEEGATAGGRGNVLFEAGLIDFRNADSVDFTDVTVLGISGGSGSGINWFTPVDADILPATSDTYNIGATNNFFSSMNASVGRFGSIENLTGTPINLLQDLNASGQSITGLSGVSVDSINESTASGGIDFNGVLLRNAQNPVDPQDVATKNYVDTELSQAVGFDPSAIDQPLLPDATATRSVGSSSLRWLDGFFQSLRGVEAITGQSTQPMTIKTVNQGSNLSGGVTVETGDSALAGISGTLNLRTGNNSVGESGNINIQTGTAGTTRGVISLNGSQVNVNSSKIINALDPTNAQDVATKNYVDTELSSFSGGGGGTDWSTPINTNITTDGGNYDLGTTSAPLQNLFSQELTLSNKTQGQNEFIVTTVDGVTTGGYSYSSAISVNGGGNPNFAMHTADNSVNDGTPSKSIVIETGAKTAGTGNSGSIYLRTGSTIGGDRGPVIVLAGGLGLDNTNIYDLADPVDALDAVNLQYLNGALTTKEDSITAGTTSQYYRGDKTFQTLDTDAVTEGLNNLYYTQARFDTAFGNKDSDALSEGLSNLYFTDERVDDRVASLVQNGTGLAWTYDDALNTFTGNVSLTGFSTSDLSEGSNLYYTDTRFDTRFGTKTTDNLTEGATNFYYTEARFDSSLSGKTTTSLTEGSNFYFTESRVLSTPLTGFTSTGSTLLATDSVLQSFQKIDEALDASPALTSGSGIDITNDVVSVDADTGAFQFNTGVLDIASNGIDGSHIQLNDDQWLRSQSGNMMRLLDVGFGNHSLEVNNSTGGSVILQSGGVDTFSINSGGFISAQNNRIQLVANPTDSTDAANKQYVDNALSEQSSQSLTNNASNINVTGLVFDKLNVKSAFVKFNIERSADDVNEQFNETGELIVTYKAKTDTWDIYLQSFGDDAGVTFDVTSTGQVQYSTSNLAGANYSATLRFSVDRELAQ